MRTTLPLIDRIRRLPAEEREALRRRALDPTSAAKTPPFQLVSDKGKYAYVQKRNRAGSRESFNGPSEILAALAQLDTEQPIPPPGEEVSSSSSGQKESAPIRPESQTVAEPLSIAPVALGVALMADPKNPKSQEETFRFDSDETNPDADENSTAGPGCPSSEEDSDTAAELPQAPSKAKRSWSSIGVWGSGAAVALSLTLGTCYFQREASKARSVAAEAGQNRTLEEQQLSALWQKLETRSGRVVAEMAMAKLADDRCLNLEHVFYAMLRFSRGKLSIQNPQRAEHEIEVVGDFAGWLAALDQSVWMRPVAFRDNWGATSTSAGLSELFKTSLRSVTLGNGQLTMRGPGLGNAVRKIFSETGGDMPTDWHVVYAHDVVQIFEKRP